MTRKPRLLDLFCGAGGAAMGYHRAGFEVVGVDINPQPHYPFEFIQADALHFLPFAIEGWPLYLGDFDAIHASPPCQTYSQGAGKWGTRDNHPDLIAPTREVLQRTGLPYVIENIEPARSRLHNPVMLCGTMFGLGVFRHRYFECSFPPPLALHSPHTGRIGDGHYVTVTGHTGGRSRRDGIQHGDVAAWKRGMGIDWMTVDELAEAIPPAYTEWIGRHLAGVAA